MKNRKGFTLVELLVTIVIMGVISGMSWPLIRRLQEQNQKAKYTTYGDALVSAAKIYVDSYEEDLFYYDEDLKSNSTLRNSLKTNGKLMNDNVTQCAMISFADLVNHHLVKDINMDEMSCNSKFTFVIVKRKQNNYTYAYYLGCGSRLKRELTDTEVSLKIPEDNNSKLLKDFCR